MAYRELPVYDLVGIGFGPSNLALAIAATEHAEGGAGRPLRTRFVERQAAFGWHRGMLLDDATMQVSFLKDLVTLRNPASRFSFLSFLHDRERLIDFINHKSLFPLRLEFHDYLEWAAQKVDDLVSWDSEVVGSTCRSSMRAVAPSWWPANGVVIALPCWLIVATDSRSTPRSSFRSPWLIASATCWPLPRSVPTIGRFPTPAGAVPPGSGMPMGMSSLGLVASSRPRLRPPCATSSTGAA